VLLQRRELQNVEAESGFKWSLHSGELGDAGQIAKPLDYCTNNTGRGPSRVELPRDSSSRVLMTPNLSGVMLLVWHQSYRLSSGAG
jgi:hypothetical protein